MIKKVFFILLLLSLIAFSSTGAKAYELPEKSGLYSVPGNAKLRLRVFVHGAGKPTPTPPPEISCTDPSSTAVVGAAGWRLPNGTWNYRLNTESLPSSVGVAGLTSAAASAFSAWSSAASGQVSFSTPGTTSLSRANLDGQNIIAWGRTQGSALGVTYTWYDRVSGNAVETDTIMNKKFTWSLNVCAANSYDAGDILTHELGHWMGLDDEYTSEYVDNTMYGYGSKAELKKNTLTTGDAQGIQNIYH